MSYTIIDIVFAAFTVFILTYSFFMGFIKRMSWALSNICAFVFSYVCVHYFGEYLKFAEKLNDFILFVIIFLISFVLFKLMFKKLSKSLKDKAILGTADRLLGLLVGVLQAAVIILISSFVILTFFKDVAKDSIVINFVSDILKLKG